MSIVESSWYYVQQLLREQLSDDFQYHNLEHTKLVLQSARRLLADTTVSTNEQQVLELAAIFHDTGFTRQYVNHEQASVAIAERYLRSQHYPTCQLERVLCCIDATRMNRMPNNYLECLLKDADLSNLGSATYFQFLPKLRYEWEVFCQQHYSEVDWLLLNRDFLRDHRYFTQVATNRYGSQCGKNLQTIERQVKQANS